MNAKEPTFDELRNEVLGQLDSVKSEEVIPFVPEKDDVLQDNYTLNIFPSKDIAHRLNLFMDELRQIEPDHYFLEPEKLHITILGQIDIDTPLDKLINTVEATLKNKEISFRLLGVGSNKLVSSFTAYPQNFSLFELRQEIRKGLGLQADDYTKFLSAYEYVGWLNYLRYAYEPSEQLLSKLRDSKNIEFGLLQPESVKLLRNNSRTLRDGSFEVIKEFSA
ncbi:hypothetical protein A2872_00790 [Candidatus Gottesmanbacteria bacterium RIFCSPHIGHO2_01_FULL_42_12]|uniref:Uncharacterized protein n=1 Tax=Candidatus Gottesmanbacteria bacterium RIFCSPHIGHO2_01_FULL_42_12 TaxID=1798377 RepID=A0A1F5Z509_9BACT|nr:MAG: hypothetical protein A2872_00790 [Candidatus Gottesmanbacteria bacterium RIFCSPHIGHO2_01_FULL_42_12]